METLTPFSDLHQLKADRLPRELGLKLLSTPRAPKELPAMAFIRNSHEIADWKDGPMQPLRHRQL